MARSITLLLGCLVLSSLVAWWYPREADRTHPSPSPARASFASAPGRDAENFAVADTVREARVHEGHDAVHRLTYGREWEGALPVELAAFRDWAHRYAGAAPSERTRLEPEGIALARARVPVMRQLIIQDPRRALEVTVPLALRRDMPEAVVALLERRVAGRGDLLLLAHASHPAEEPATPGSQHYALVNGAYYDAHVYGRRNAQMTRRGVSLHGIAIESDLALHESPVRALEPEEPTSPASNALCPVAPAAADLMHTCAHAVYAEAFGEIWEFCSTGTDMLEQFEQRLIIDETSKPNVAPAVDRPATAAASATSHTIGSKRVLVIRVDFSDVPGAAVTAAAAQSVMDQEVRPFFERSSYGQTTLVTTVSSKVYRLPETAVRYAVDERGFDIFRHASAAAGADFTISSYDRVIVIHPYIGSSRIPGSRINNGGTAFSYSSEVWLNGIFDFAIVAHELGHTYGLSHANLWRVSDGNPISGTGTSVEYGDPFDVMGASGVDARFDFNMVEKNRLGWLPDRAVRTVAASGTYRVYRFDHPDALASNQPLALRVARDGMRTYWIGLRQSFPANAPVSNGAYVIWGYESAQATDLLDLTTPGMSSNDAALAVGATFTDPLFGITLRPVARGGSEPAQYLDIEVTMPATVPNGVWGWGGYGAVPPGIINIQAIAADDSHVLALRSDGTVVSWWSSGEPLAVPAGLGDVRSIAVGSGSSAAIRSDGTVELWGILFTNVARPPAGLTGIRQVAIGGYHALALKTDGTMIVWGSNDSGQAIPPPGLNDIIAIAAGRRTSFALKSDGSIVRWGATYANAVPLPPEWRQGIAISAHSVGQHLLALKSDGALIAVGSNDVGQADVPPWVTNVVAMAAGSSTSLALRADGTVVSWGNRGGLPPVPANLPRAFGVAVSSQRFYALTGSGAFITRPPASQSVAAGSPLVLSVEVSAVGAATYQWRKNGVAVAGATGATFALPAAGPADAGFYDAVITTPANVTTSLPARVVIVPPLVIARQPQPQTVELGTSASFGVEATGSGPLTYQWRNNSVPIPGATTRVLTVNSVTPTDAGSYDVLLADGFSTLRSATAELATFGATRIANLSIRANAGSGAQTLVVGFVIGGPPPRGGKPLLLRAAGPALAAFGVSGVLADPRIELYRDTTRIAENDDWSGHVGISSVAAQVGAFTFSSPLSRDAALYAETLSAGAYTLQATGTAGASGEVLTEIYDATPPGVFSVTTQRLVNISARTQVGAGGSILIAGFSISGTRPKTVLIRGVGPTLAGFGVDGVLTDPKLEVYDRTPVKIRENDNWGGGDLLVDTFRAVGAFPLPPTSRDAALVSVLAPGSYTVQISGVGGATGAALVEIYEVP